MDDSLYEMNSFAAPIHGDSFEMDDMIHQCKYRFEKNRIAGDGIALSLLESMHFVYGLPIPNLSSYRIQISVSKFPRRASGIQTTRRR